MNFMKSKPTSTAHKVVNNSNNCNDINKGGSLSKRGVGDDWYRGKVQESIASLELGTKRDPRENPGKFNSNNFNILILISQKFHLSLFRNLHQGGT